MRCSFLLLSALSLLALVSQKAAANTDMGTLSVTAQILGSCTVTPDVTNLQFGVYTPGTAKPGQATISVTCTSSVGGSTSVVLGLDQGDGAGGQDTNPRFMTITGGGSNLLPYSLFQDVDHLITWGNSTPNLPPPLSVASGGTTSRVVYGQIPATVTPTPVGGNYLDTVTITATFTPT